MVPPSSSKLFLSSTIFLVLNVLVAWFIYPDSLYKSALQWTLVTAQGATILLGIYVYYKEKDRSP